MTASRIVVYHTLDHPTCIDKCVIVTCSQSACTDCVLFITCSQSACTDCVLFMTCSQSACNDCVLFMTYSQSACTDCVLFMTCSQSLPLIQKVSVNICLLDSADSSYSKTIKTDEAKIVLILQRGCDITLLVGCLPWSGGRWLARYIHCRWGMVQQIRVPGSTSLGIYAPL